MASFFVVCVVPRLKPNPDRLAKRRWTSCNHSRIAGRDGDARSRVPRSSGRLIAVCDDSAGARDQTSGPCPSSPTISPPYFPLFHAPGRGRDRRTMRAGPSRDMTEPASMPFCPPSSPLHVRRPWRPNPVVGLGAHPLASSSWPLWRRRWGRRWALGESEPGGVAASAQHTPAPASASRILLLAVMSPPRS
jgi:hypothetical protein